MKIVHVTKSFYPDIGGIQTVIWRLSHFQQKENHYVGVITLDRLLENRSTVLPLEEIIDGIKINRIPYWGSRRYPIAPGVWKYIREYDIIHLHSSDFYLDFLALSGSVHKRPIVLSTHGLFFHTDFAQHFKKIYFQVVTRLSLSRISKVVCVSHHDFTLVRKIIQGKNIQLIPNGIDFEKLSALEAANRDPNLFISVGRLAPNKRYDRLLETFSLLVGLRPKSRLVIIGPDMGLLATLKELSRIMKIENHVQFAGSLSDNELLDYLRRASICLAASQYEGFGVALLEAMAAGCLPVIQPLSVFEELVEGGVEGIYVDFDKPQKAADLIHKAANLSDVQRNDFVLRARTKASKFSWESVNHQYEEVYKNVLINTKSKV